MARAISQEHFSAQLVDPAEALRLIEVPKPEAASAGHVVVRLLARPVHQVDLNWVAGSVLRHHADSGRPVVPGSEAVGVVEFIGEGVTSVKPGQRVVPLLFFYYQGQGAWQDYVEVAEDHVLPVPSRIPDEIAAQFICNPWSAYGLLVDLEIPRGGYLLQNAAGSVIGRLIISLAKHQGIRTVNVVRREELRPELKALGADEVINSTTEDVEQRVKEITGGKGADGAVEMVGGEQTKTFAASVVSGGRVLSLGSVETLDRAFELRVRWIDLSRDVELRAWGLLKFIKKHDVKQIASHVWKLLEDKVMEPVAGQKFDLADYGAAFRAAHKKAAGNAGKVLLVSYS